MSATSTGPIASQRSHFCSEPLAEDQKDLEKSRAEEAARARSCHIFLERQSDERMNPEDDSNSTGQQVTTGKYSAATMGHKELQKLMAQSPRISPVTVKISWPAITIPVLLNDTPITMVVDTGAQVSLLNRPIPGSMVQPTIVQAQGAGGEPIQFQGTQTLRVRVGTYDFSHEFHVLPMTSKGLNLMGLDLLVRVPVNLTTCDATTEGQESVRTLMVIDSLRPNKDDELPMEGWTPPSRIYSNGKAMSHPDGLSRPCVANSGVRLYWPLLRTAQELDPWVHKMRERSPTPAREIDGVLCLQTTNPDGSPIPIIPSTLRQWILKTCHESQWAGHHGQAATEELVRRYGMWPKLIADVKRFIQCCGVCQSRNTPRNLIAVQHPYFPERPMEMDAWLRPV